MHDFSYQTLGLQVGELVDGRMFATDMLAKMVADVETYRQEKPE